MAVGSDPQVNDDLFTKIALENKLVTKYQLRKASEEQQKLEGEGETADLGQVLIRMGFLSERQHQSVVNACSYRGQRDYDKRFGRQCLRMELLDQERIEEALSTQKAEYMKSGTVRPLAEILQEEGALEEEELDTVNEGIRKRDRARAAARSGKNPALATSTTTPLAKGKQPNSDEADLDEADLDEEDLDEEDLDEEDLDEADLDEADLDEADLDEADLDEADLDDEDLDDEDLEDIDLDDEDLDDEDLDDEDLEDIDLDDLDDEGDENEEATSKSGSGSAIDIDIDIDIDDVDLDDDDDEDEDDLAEVVSEVDSDVQLDDDDLKDLETMGSAEEDDETASWTADAFDDRPLDKRSPSERSAVQAPPQPMPLPATAVEPDDPPVVPRAAGSSRLTAAGAAAKAEVDGGRIVAGVASGIGQVDRDDDSYPGSDVFEAGVSDLGQIADLNLDDEAEVRGSLASTASDLSPVEAAPKPDTKQAPDYTQSELGARESEVHFGPRALAQAAARAAQKSKAESVAAPSPASSAGPPPAWLDDPRLRMAFEKALQAAWEVFVQELGRGES